MLKIYRKLMLHREHIFLQRYLEFVIYDLKVIYV